MISYDDGYDDDDVDDGILSKSFANIAMKIMAAPKIKAQSLSPVSGSLQQRREFGRRIT